MNPPDKCRHLACFKPVNPDITCADGFTLSVQASARHFCEPRTNSGPWSHFEVRCDASETLLAPFAHEPTMSPGIFFDVPEGIIVQVMAQHGGRVEGQLPQPLTNDDLCDLLVQANQHRL